MKKFLNLFLIIVLVVSFLPNISNADRDDDKIDTTKLMPLLNVENSSIPQGHAGSTITIPLTIRNKSSYSARNVVITPEFIAEDNPFTFNDLSFTQTIDKIDGKGSRSINLKLAIAPGATEKNYPIKLNYTYTNGWDNPGSSSEIIYVRVINKNVPPRIVISKVDISPESINPGDEVTVGLNIENKGSIDAKDIKFTLDGLSNEGFVMATGSNIKYQPKLSGSGVGYIKFDLKASKKIPRGGHGLDLKISYKDSQNKEYEDSQKFFINIDEKSGKNSNILIENISYPEGTVRPGTNFTIGFDVKNVGEIDANNVKVVVESPDPAVIPKTATTKKINKLALGESANLTYVLSPTDEATSKNYPINITIEYTDELSTGEDKYIVTQYLGVYVEKKGEGNAKGKPKLIIDKYSFEPTLAKAGENFTMNLSFFNTNSKKAVKNIKISLVVDEKTEQSGNVFTPVGSSNTFFIDSIPPKGRVAKSITMFTVPDAKPKSYTITANFEYENADGEEFTATELIGVPVVQQSKLDVGEISIPPEVFIGEPTPMFVEFYNTGKVTLYNTMVRIEGNFQTENGNYFVGNFESGSSENFEGTIIPNDMGELKGKIIFSYDDTSGEHVEIVKDFSMNVIEAPPMEDSLEEMPPEKTSLFKKKGFWITVIIALSVGGFFFYKKRKKKKEGMALDE
ncbi:COG1361 S-layer family protein [Anaerosalibacter sp. Marseille-P3206]|uniref:COG1361 S-layer family protein n=1 Tax=Anaerosalibacter sp. Marseille-P3206 TaxID=1871005 RepID=UPI0009861441|nr:CARDB domain-containing protein [Anaerosalibacter sp. Marseille-P3206]